MMVEKGRIRKCVCEKKEETGSMCVRERERERENIYIYIYIYIYISGKNDFYTLARESFLEIRLKIDVLTLYIRTFLNSRRLYVSMISNTTSYPILSLNYYYNHIVSIIVYTTVS